MSSINSITYPTATLESAGIFTGTILEMTQIDITSLWNGYLITETGLRFPLQTSNTVGRSDKQDIKTVDIDLVPLGRKVVSHQYARIDYLNGRFHLEDTPSTNVTWLNGTKLEANSPKVLANGDVIEFCPGGKGGVKLIFHENKNNL